MIYKRTIPKVTMAALTLGSAGAAVMGCGKSDPVRAFCQKIADCENYGSRYVDRCVDDLNHELSYYGPRCERAIRSVLSCMSGLTCRQLDSSTAIYENCGDEILDWYYECG
jgi:hypothetical protein